MSKTGSGLAGILGSTDGINLNIDLSHTHEVKIVNITLPSKPTLPDNLNTYDPQLKSYLTSLDVWMTAILTSLRSYVDQQK